MFKDFLDDPASARATQKPFSLMNKPSQWMLNEVAETQVEETKTMVEV